MDPFLINFFPALHRIEEVDKSTNDFMLTTCSSSLYMAALVASLFASWTTTKFGPKMSMLLGGLVFLTGAGVSVCAHAAWMLILGRIFLGIGVGFSIQSVPIYTWEMAPYMHRGKFNALFQLCITIGIFVGNLVNYLAAKHEQRWRYSLGGACVPAALLVVVAFFLPGTPNSMVEKGQEAKARSLLRRLRGAVHDEEVEDELHNLIKPSEAARQVKNPWTNLFKKREYRPHLAMAFLIPSFQQLTGTNMVMFHAPVLLQSIGLGNEDSIIGALLISFTNVLATFISMWVIDKLERRSVFLHVGFHMLLTQISLIATEFMPVGQQRKTVMVIVYMSLVGCQFGSLWGTLGWVVPSEIFPQEIRSAAQSVVASVNIISSFLIAEFFFRVLLAIKCGLFFFFAFFAFAMTLFMYFLLPETKVPIEEISQVWKYHWFWKRFTP